MEDINPINIYYIYRNRNKDDVNWLNVKEELNETKVKSNDGDTYKYNFYEIKSLPKHFYAKNYYDSKEIVDLYKENNKNDLPTIILDIVQGTFIYEGELNKEKLSEFINKNVSECIR
jgi:hypothetical protein